MRPPGHRTGQHFDCTPFAADQYCFGADNYADGAIAMSVALEVDGHAAWHRAGHPVGRYPCARHFGHANGHTDAAEAIRHASDCGGDDLCIGLRVTAHLVLVAVNLAAQRCALQQDIYETKPITPGAGDLPSH